MAKYRKKPVVIDAWKIESAIQDGELAKAVADGKVKYCEDGSVLIVTLEGTMRGNPGDWIICGVNGEYYPCKPDVFAKTYEAVVVALNKVEEDFAPTIDDEIDNFIMVSQANDN